MGQRSTVGFEESHEALAPVRAEHRQLISDARRWSLEQGAPVPADLVALIIAGTDWLSGPDEGPLTWWTRPRVNELLMRGIFNWCSAHRCLTPDGVPRAVWRWLDFLVDTDRLDEGSDPLRVLREPLMCYGGLDEQGRELPDAEPLDPCRCYLPYSPEERRRWPPR